jgi:hypothetical protein
MKGATKVLALLLLVLLLATPTQATTLFVSWSHIQNFYNVHVDGTIRSFGLGIAHGYLDYGTSQQLDIGQVWCVDMLNWSGSSPWAVVEHHDGTSWDTNDGGWTGEDTYRIGSWQQVAWMVNTFGGQVADDADKTVALNTAMYAVAYGANVVESDLYSQLNASEQTYYTTYKLAASGKAAGETIWFDNDDPGEYYQDFMGDVPEPSSLLMLGGVMTVGALMAWKKRR